MTRSSAPRRRRRATAEAADGEPKSGEDVAVLVAQAVELLMGRGVKACLRAKLPSTIILMAAGEQAGLVASMMGLPYPQALQAVCNGVESVYRVAAPDQVTAERPIEKMAAALAGRDVAGGKTPQNGCELGKGSDGGLTPS